MFNERNDDMQATSEGTGAGPAGEAAREGTGGAPAPAPMVLGPHEGESVDMGGFGARFMAAGEGFALVEHPIAPRTLAAPMHTHRHEDEYTYVLEGEIGVQVGDEIRYATAGDLVF